MATATAPAHAGNKQQAPAAPLPFRAGTQPSDVQDFQPPAVTLSTSTQTLPPYHPTPNSFIRGVWIQVSATYPSNAVATIAFQGDGPFNVLNTVSLTDTQQRFIVGPINGFDLMCINLFGGYQFMNDPRASAAFSAPLTSTPTGFSFALYIPLEITSRDGLGSLVNKSTASQLNVNVTLETNGNVFATPPTNPAVVTVTFSCDGYLQPAAADAQGNPLAQNPQAIGTTQFWAKSSYNASAGSNPNIQLTGGLGFPIRNIIFENYGVATPTRANGETQWPTPLIVDYKGVTLFNRNKIVWQEKMARAFGLTNATADGPLSKPSGVYALPFNLDFTNAPGDELRNGYLQTSSGSILSLAGTWGLASTLFELVNYVVPANGNPGSIRAGGR